MTDSLIERLRKLCTWGAPMVDGKSRTDGLMEAAATMAKQAERIADLEMEVSTIEAKDATIEAQDARIEELEAKVRAAQWVADIWDDGLGSWMSAALDDKNVCADMKSDINAMFEALAAYQSDPSPTDPVRDAAGELLEALNCNGLADRLMEMRADKCLLTTDDHLGWPDGLSVPLNDPDTGDRECVAHLDLEDSGFGPMLWDYAISVLKARAAIRRAEGGQG